MKDYIGIIILHKQEKLLKRFWQNEKLIRQHLQSHNTGCVFTITLHQNVLACERGLYGVNQLATKAKNKTDY